MPVNFYGLCQVTNKRSGQNNYRRYRLVILFNPQLLILTTNTDSNQCTSR